MESLSNKLTNEFGSGFSSVSIRRMRRFYEFYPIWSTVSTELSWAHFQKLIKIDRKEEREFYEKESIRSNWGGRELRRQINKILADCLVTLVWKDRIKISKYIINDRVNKNNVDEFCIEFMNSSSKNNFDNDELKNKYKELEEMLIKIKMN